MSTASKIILREYKRAFRQLLTREVVDLDKRLDENIACFILCIQSILPELNYRVPPNKVNRFQLLFVKEGRGEKTIGTYHFSIKPNTLMVIAPRRIHSGVYENAQLEGYFLSFNPSFFLQKAMPAHLLKHSSIFSPNVKPFAYLKPSQGNAINKLLTSISEESTQPQQNSEEIIALRILETLLLTERYFGQNADKPANKMTSRLAEQFLDLLERYYTTAHTVKFFAEQLRVHPNYLNSVTKKQMGFSAKKLIDEKLILEAKHLLQHTTASAKEIASELGFSDQQTFFRFFKKIVSIGPTAYRKSAC